MRTSLAINKHEADPLSVYDEELAKIERLTQMLAVASRRVKKARNAHIWIYELPVELLQMIFAFAGEGGADYMTALSISWTCSHWRSSSVNDPLLWGHIPLASNADIRALFLERSKPADLTISSRGWHGLLRDENICRRVSSLSLQFQKSSDFIGEHAVYNLPNLTSLEIELRSIYPGQEMTCGILSSSKFDSLTSLRTLTLDHGRFPWNSSIYSNLTHLSVRFGSLFPVRSYRDHEEDEDILDIFRSSPNLRSLQLHLWSPLSSRWGQTPSPVRRPHNRKIKMANLTSITLGVPLLHAVHILESISIPVYQMTNIDITFYDRETDAVLESLFSDNCLPSVLFHNLHELAISDSEPYLTGLRGVGHHKDGQEYTVRVVQSRLVARDCFRTILRDLRHLVPPTPILRHLILQIPEVESTIYKRNRSSFLQMTSFFRRCLPVISRLSIIGFHPTLLEVLTERATKAFRDTTNPQPLRLNTLEIDAQTKSPGVVLKLSDLDGLEPFCRTLGAHGASLNCLSFLGAVEATHREEIDKYVEDLNRLHIPVDWTTIQFRYVQDRAVVIYKQIDGEWTTETKKHVRPQFTPPRKFVFAKTSHGLY